MLSQLLAKCQQIHERLWRGPLTPLQFRLLDHLEREGPSVQSYVIESITTDRSTLSELAKRLHDQRLINRYPDTDDRRKMVFSITERGLTALKKTRKHLETTDAEFLGILTLKDRTLFVELLAEVSNAHG